MAGDGMEETKPPGETVHVPKCCGHGAPPGVTSQWAPLIELEEEEEESKKE